MDKNALTFLRELGGLRVSAAAAATKSGAKKPKLEEVTKPQSPQKIPLDKGIPSPLFPLKKKSP